MPLTDLEVKRARARAKPYKISDSGGLFLWVTPSGGKIWRWSYRFQQKQRLMTLGKYPEVSLALARDGHAEERRRLAGGRDPMTHRKDVRAVKEHAHKSSFSFIAGLWLEHWEKGKSRRHVETTRRRLSANILSSLGALPIAEIQAPQIVAMVQAIERRGARDVAKRALETAGQIFRYAIAHGHAQRNPATEVRPRDILSSSLQVNFARIEARELPRLLQQIEIYPGTHVTRMALKLMALTFVRTGELIGARWSEFDFEAARWNIPAGRMKMKSEHIVPLSKQALVLLRLLREAHGSQDWVFPGDRDAAKPMSNNTILKGLERMGYKGRMTGHGFRGLASTILHEQEYPHEHIELQLAHAPRNSVSAAYNHALHMRGRAKMMQEWADFLEQAQCSVQIPDL